ncbi:hypothetical protein ACV70F_004896, partial [Escherichia coli]
KKKFVVSSDYTITFDLLSTELKSEVLANVNQIQKWKDLGLVTTNNYADYPYLPVDTELFSPSFKEKIVNSIDNIDSK